MVIKVYVVEDYIDMVYFICKDESEDDTDNSLWASASLESSKVTNVCLQN